MRSLIIGIAFVGWSGAAVAAETSFEEERTAIYFGTILAAEEPCGMTFDANAIKQYISDNVPASVISFPATLTRWTRMQKSRVTDMTGSEKTAYCASAEQTAKHIGFIK